MNFSIKKIRERISPRFLEACASCSLHRFLLAAAAVGILSAAFFMPEDALARAGGGHSYSGGSSSSSSSGGGSVGGILYILRFLFWLCRYHPAIGYPLTILFIIFLIFWTVKSNGTKEGFSTTSNFERAEARSITKESSLYDSLIRPDSAPRIQSKFESLSFDDHNFSRPLFEDFVYFLYGVLQRSRGTSSPEIRAYASDYVLETLRSGEPVEVSGIVIGSMRILKVQGIDTPTITVDISIESNITEKTESGENRFYLHQLMRLSRRARAQSRQAYRIRVLDCPNCGAPLDNMTGKTCGYCGCETGTGFNDWLVVDLMTIQKNSRGPLLTSTVEEEGTDLPTVVSPTMQENLRSLTMAHPEVTPEAIEARAKDIWTNLQEGWMNRDALKIRPFVTDNLFEHMVYWITMYKTEQCRNVCIGEGSRGILSIEIASVNSDRNFDSVTIRLTAETPEYTISDSGDLLSGSKSSFRKYSEYWTLIRGHVSDKMHSDPTKCPACGAALNISAGGNCEYCQAKITTGDFDWVLSRIEQDESYAG